MATTVLRNPLLADPSRTKILRDQFSAELKRRLVRVQRAVYQLVVEEDAFGLLPRNAPKYLEPIATNAYDKGKWKFLSNDQKVAAFHSWLKQNVDQKVFEQHQTEEDGYWKAYIEQGFKKGAGRAFDDVKKKYLQSKEQLDFYAGTKSEFLRSAFAQPESVDKVKLLASRTFTDLKNATDDMATKVRRNLVDGLVRGANPRELVAELSKEIDVTKNRADIITRTEIIRAHAEGQLHALEKVGVEEVGVAVEWSTAGDHRVCPLCQPLEGIVLAIKEAHGLIPRHPRCRCAFLPANVGESDKDQVRTRAKVTKAITDSIEKEVGKQEGPPHLAAKKAREKSKWAGAQGLKGDAPDRKVAPQGGKLRKPKAKKPIEPPPPPEPPKPKFTESGLPLRDAVTIESDLPGSTGPKLVTDANGKKWVMKEGLKPEHIRSEVLADDLYRKLGANVPRSGIVDGPNGPIKFSEFLDDAEPLGKYLNRVSEAEKAKMLAEIQEQFVADALLGNRDVAGLSMDNILVKNGKAWRIDNGGSLLYRAQGELKKDFAREVIELQSLRNPSINPQTAQLFKTISQKDIEDQIEKIVKAREELLAAIPDAKLQKIIGERIDWLDDQLPKGKVTKEFVKAVKASRINGKTLPTDRDEIEDMGLLVWEELDAAGKKVTRVTGKLTAKGLDKVADIIGDTFTNVPGSAAALPSDIHPDDVLWDYILPAAKTVNYHVGDGMYNMMHLKGLESKKQFIQMKMADADASAKKMYKYYLDAIDKIQQAAASKASVGVITQYKVPPKKVTKKAKQEVERRLRGELRPNALPTSEIENGYARRQPASNVFNGNHVVVHADDIEVKVFPRNGKVTNDHRSGKAFEGTIDLTIPGEASVETIEKAKRTLADIGIDTSPPSPEYNELVYLHRSIRFQIKGNGVRALEYSKIYDDPNLDDKAKVQQLKQWVKKTFKIDLANNPHYRPEGFSATSFGDGHKHWWRWDLPPEKIEEDMKDYMLHHSVSGRMVDVVRGMLQSGGQATSTVQRIRKGVNVSATGGSSSQTDIQTGGADYFFTRIKKKSDEVFRDSGFEFKVRNLARQDAISYNGDRYGNTDLADSFTKARAADVAGFKKNAGIGNNETIFKHGLSLLDDVDYIVTPSSSSRDDVLKVLRENKITHFPDGRPIEKVVVSERDPRI